jgi:beta-xylosidase
MTSAACAWRNPVWHGYLADPFVWRSHGSYFAIGTGAAGAGSLVSGIDQGRAATDQERIFPLLQSDDFCTWQARSLALIRPDPLLGPEFWAPAVAEHDGRFYLYYSVGDSSIPRHQLRVAISTKPEGPYADFGPLTDVQKMPFAIDAHPFLDVDGRWWLFYARDFLDNEGGAYAGTALVVDRMKSMTELAGHERVVLRARQDWTLFRAQREMYGSVWDWHTLEGPCVLRHDDQYYCLYSGACWGNASYGVDYCVAEHIDGTYDAGFADAPRVLRTNPGVVLGPGHCSHIIGPDGGDYLAYHAWDEAAQVRRMHIDRLLWTPNGPRCTPTTTEQLIAHDHVASRTSSP